MSKKNEIITFNKDKEKLNGIKKIKYKNTLIDLAIKKSIHSKLILLKFFSGKKLINDLCFKNRLF